MPKTKTQDVVFSILMAMTMVYGMEGYNGFIRLGGFSFSVLLMPLWELAGLSAVVILLEKTIGGPLARKLAFLIVQPQKSKPTVVILMVSMMTVLCMCPLMSAVAALLYKGGLSGHFLRIWMQTVVINFPMAFCWQMLVAGPVVRTVFHAMFRKQLQGA